MVRSLNSEGTASSQDLLRLLMAQSSLFFFSLPERSFQNFKICLVEKFCKAKYVLFMFYMAQMLGATVLKSIVEKVLLYFRLSI